MAVTADASRLDDPALLELDRSGMFGHIADVGRQLELAWAASEKFALVPGPAPTAVAIAGVGGSATAGDYFAAIASAQAGVPVMVVRGPALPGHVGAGTVVVACSYSGNTEETLGAYHDARARGARLAVITRGGELGARAAADGVPMHRITYEASPRATTVHTLAPLLRLGNALGLVDTPDGEVAAAARAHTTFVTTDLAPTSHGSRNGAKQLAALLQGRLPLVIGAEHLGPAASRFKNQLAENGKVLGAADALPEAAHNLVVGLDTAGPGSPVMLVTLESHDGYEPRTQARFDVVTALFERQGLPVFRIDVGGSSLLQQLLVATAWGDYTSCYLALLNGVDPTPVPQIEAYRAEMAARPR